MDWRTALLFPAVIFSALGVEPGLASAADAPLPKGVKQGASIEGITEYSLDNGLKVLLFPDSSKPTVTINMTVLVGSRHEGYGEAGMAHLLEHMLFKGTPSYPSPTSIPSVMKERGARFNASTWTDRTNFHETLPASESNLEFAIKLEADRLVNSFVRNADLKSEMTVVRNEFEMGENSPEDILMQRMIAAAFEWHNYGKSTIGNRADIERVPIENLRDFYVRYYQPDNTILVVAGQFDPHKALELIAQWYGRIPRPDRQLNTTYTEEPPQDGEHMVRLRRVGDVARVGVAYHIPAGGHPDFPAVEVLEGILSDEPSGRLYKSLVETKKAAQVYGLTFSWHDPAVMIEMAKVAKGEKAENPQAVLDDMLSTIAGVAKEGVTQEETERIKRQILKHREMAAANSARIALELSEWAAQGDWRLYFLHRDRIEKVTKDDVNKAAAKYLKPDNSTVGLFLPTRSPDRTTVPPVTDLASTIGAYKGREGIAMGEAFDVSPKKIDARTKYQQLSSGLKAAFLEKKTRGNAVHLHFKLRYGDVKNLQNRRVACELLPELMMRGTKTLSHQQIQDELDKNKATLHAGGAPGELTFSIVTRREKIPAVLHLLRQIAREPSFPAKELDIIKGAQISALQSALTEPDELAMNAIRRHLAPYQKGDPRYVPLLNEEIDIVKGVTVGDLRKLYTEYVNGAHGELTVLGDFDTAQVLPAINSVFADWKPAAPYARIKRDVEFTVSGGDRQIITPDKANANYVSALIFPMRDDDADYPAMAIGNFIFGGGTLSSRLGDRVRQKEGLSYGVASILQVSPEDHRAVFLVEAICNPANIGKVQKAITEEFERFLAKGISEKELAQAKTGYLNRSRNARAQDESLSRILMTNLAAKRTMQYYAEQEQRIKSLTTDQVLAAMRRHLEPKRIFIVTAGDFKKAVASKSR